MVFSGVVADVRSVGKVAKRKAVFVMSPKRAQDGPREARRFGAIVRAAREVFSSIETLRL